MNGFSISRYALDSEGTETFMTGLACEALHSGTKQLSKDGCSDDVLTKCLN
jgi:hypothetical protein